jgi:dihydrofolate synthase/folylpolyglutamate synthase
MDAYARTLDDLFNLRGGEIDLRLDRVERALERFGHPELGFPAVHIAGTNGKGSTAALVHSVLSAQGYRAGLYTSPHLLSFTERIQVGSEPIAPAEVVELASRLKDALGAAGVELTFFEFTTVMAFVHFAARKIDVGVIEVGMGGRLDATNVVRPVACAITSIARDHEDYLGRDLLSIGREKAGIIKPGVPVVCGRLPREVRGLIGEIARGLEAPALFYGRDFSIRSRGDRFDFRGQRWELADLGLSLSGMYQRRNAAVALALLEAAEGTLAVGERAIRQGLATANWPGRLEAVLSRPLVILDGAHNPEGIEALAAELRRRLGKRKARVLFGVMRDKNWEPMLAALSRVAREVVFCRVPMERSAAPEELARAAGERLAARVIDRPEEGLAFLLRTAAPDDVIVVTGSLYLLGAVRPSLAELGVEPPSASDGVR